jgi:hypothetical protein
MDLYSAALFIHFIGLVTLFIGLGLLQNIGPRLRRSTTNEEARALLGPLQSIGAMFLAGAVFLIVTGAYMAANRWSMRAPWVVVSLVVLVLFLLPGAGAVARHLRRASRAVRDTSGSLADSVHALIVEPNLWGAIFAMNGLTLGVIWLMTRKPGWTESIVVPLVLLVIGYVVGIGVSRGRLGRAEEDRRHPRSSGRLAHGDRH